MIVIYPLVHDWYIHCIIKIYDSWLMMVQDYGIIEEPTGRIRGLETPGFYVKTVKTREIAPGERNHVHVVVSQVIGFSSNISHYW